MLTDTRYIQKLIDRGGDILIPRINPLNGTCVYEIKEPLVLKSHCHVVLDGCILRLKDGVYSNVFITKGAWEGSKEMFSDIEIHGKNGAIIDGGNFNGLTEVTANTEGRPIVLHNTFILLSHVKGFRISGLVFRSPRYWNMTYFYCSEGIIENIYFNSDNDAPNQDGIDLRKGCHDIVIRNIIGSTGDDTVALTGLQSTGESVFADESMKPDIFNVKILNILTEVTGGHGVIRLLCHDGICLHDVEIRNVYDCLMDTGRTRNRAAVRIADTGYWKIRPMKEGEMYSIVVDNILTNAVQAVEVNAAIPDLAITNVDHRG